MPFGEVVTRAGAAVGLTRARMAPVGCVLGRMIYALAHRSAVLANRGCEPRALQATTQERLRTLFPDLDLGEVRVRTGCRLPANRFRPDGRFYGMTFGTTIFWRGELDEDDPVDLVKLVHEVVHVDQARRLGGRREFACRYGRGYLEGGGELPAHIDSPTAYHRNPLEAEAYAFDARFRDERGRVVPGSLPGV